MIAPRTIPGTQAVTRAVSLLKAFSVTHPDWRLADLARIAHLHRATAHRLLAALEREGMVARDTTGDLYRLGPEAIALGARAARATDLRAASRPVIEALAASTGETATLEVPAGTDMLILDEAAGGALLGATPSVGTRWPMHATSTGKALLAALPPAALVTALPSRLARFTDRTVVTRAALERELTAIRRRGYATAIEELERGFAAVGSVVLGRDDTPVAALSIGGPRMRMTDRRIPALGRSVRRAAEQIAAALGHRELS